MTEAAVGVVVLLDAGGVLPIAAVSPVRAEEVSVALSPFAEQA